MNILKMTVRKQFQLLQHKNNKIVKLTTKRATCILKSSLQDHKERLNNQKDSLCPWRVQDLILFTLQTVTLPNLNYRHTTISIKIPAASPLVLFCFFFFGRNSQTNPQIHMETQGTQNCQNNPEKEEKSEGLTLCAFETYCNNQENVVLA